MTEAEWAVSTDPEAMLNYLSDKASERKFRLYACACCRAIWPFLEEVVSRRAVAAAEDFADGLIERAALRAARRAAGQFGPYQAGWVVGYVVAGPEGWYAAHAVLDHATKALAPPESPDRADQEQAVHADFAHLLRDIIGNPFRPASFEHDWPGWQGGDILRVAQVIYQEYRFEELPILADALEEAGCTNAEVLAHCREPGPHARGCWALDLVLGRT